MRRWGVFGLIALYVLRIDLWFWRDATLIGGVPVGLAYHVIFCFLASAWFWWMVSKEWPRGLDGSTDSPSPNGLPDESGDSA